MFRPPARTAFLALLIAMALNLVPRSAGRCAENDADAASTRFYQDVRRFVLDNGLVVLIKPSSKAGTAAAYLGVKSGSADELDGLGTGLSHYLEHMLFKGAARRKASDFEAEVRRMGGSSNAYTSYDLTVYYLHFLSGHLDGALDLLADVAFHATFPPEEMEKERDVILGEFRLNEDRLGRKADLALWQLAFQTHPYGHPVIGYRPVFEKVTRDDLVRYYRRNYVPNNMVLSVVGDIDPAEAERLVRLRFGEAERASLVVRSRPSEPAQMTPRREVIRKEAEHARLLVGFPGVAVSHPDAVALDVLSVILGEGASSRLVQRLVERERLVLEIASFNATLKDAGLFGVRARVLPEKAEEARAAVLSEINGLKETPVGADELERVKNRVLAQFYGNLETHGSLAHDLVTSEIYTGDYRFSEVYPKLEAAIGPHDIQRVARQYLRRDTTNDVLLLPAAVPGEAAPAARETGAPRRAPAAIERTVLPNGLRVLLMRDPGLPNVAVHFALRGGTRFEDERTNGVSSLTAELLTKGTALLTQEDVARRFESWGGAIDAFSGQESYGLTLSVLAPYAADALGLLADLLTGPAFHADDFEKARAIQTQKLLAKEEDIFAMASDAIRKAVYRDHPYRLDPLGTKDSLARLRREDAERFYRGTLDARRAVLSVFGDIDPAAVRREVEARFGGLPAELPPLPAPAGEPFIRGAESLVHRVPREQAVALLVFNGVRFSDASRTAYEILNAVTDGSSGRLYRSVRGKEGLAYVVGSNLSTSLDPGHFVLYASVHPAKAEKALALLEEEARRLRDRGVTGPELEDAKRQLLGDHEHALEAKTASIVAASFHELYGPGFEEFLRTPERIVGTTPEDVAAVIRGHLDPSRSVRIVVGPAAGKDAPRKEGPGG
jgi:zinc protease